MKNFLAISMMLFSLNSFSQRKCDSEIELSFNDSTLQVNEISFQEFDYFIKNKGTRYYLTNYEVNHDSLKNWAFETHKDIFSVADECLTIYDYQFCPGDSLRPYTYEFVDVLCDYIVVRELGYESEGYILVNTLKKELPGMFQPATINCELIFSGEPIPFGQDHYIISLYYSHSKKRESILIKGTSRVELYYNDAEEFVFSTRKCNELSYYSMCAR